MICFGGTNFYPDRTESHCYTRIVNFFRYGQMRPDSAAQEDIFYLATALYTSLARTCLFATKSVLQAK